MRKLFWQMNVTLDGLIEGPHHELDYTAQFPDPDFDRYASEMLQSIDGILLGRRTYELFAGYWPAATGPDADRLNELPKTVFSRTLKSLQWNNSRLVSDNVVQEVRRLKRESGKELALFGSADLGSALVRLGLIDEIRLLVSPVILGKGTPMFQEIDRRVDLKLTHASTWSSGIVVLYYELLPTGSSGVNDHTMERTVAGHIGGSAA
jgi:dihydrofolate reductase